MLYGLVTILVAFKLFNKISKRKVRKAIAKLAESRDIRERRVFGIEHKNNSLYFLVALKNCFAFYSLQYNFNCVRYKCTNYYLSLQKVFL